MSLSPLWQYVEDVAFYPTDPKSIPHRVNLLVEAYFLVPFLNYKPNVRKFGPHLSSYYHLAIIIKPVVAREVSAW